VRVDLWSSGAFKTTSSNVRLKLPGRRCALRDNDAVRQMKATPSLDVRCLIAETMRATTS